MNVEEASSLARLGVSLALKGSSKSLDLDATSAALGRFSVHYTLSITRHAKRIEEKIVALNALWPTMISDIVNRTICELRQLDEEDGKCKSQH